MDGRWLCKNVKEKSKSFAIIPDRNVNGNVIKGWSIWRGLLFAITRIIFILKFAFVLFPYLRKPIGNWKFADGMNTYNLSNQLPFSVSSKLYFSNLANALFPSSQTQASPLNMHWLIVWILFFLCIHSN